MESKSSPTTKSRRVTGAFLIYLTGIVLIGSSLAKLLQVPKVVSEFSSMGFDGNNLMLIALLEITSAVLLLVPLTRAIGFPMASAYLGGAIATHLQHAQSPAGPAGLLALIWLGIWLRHPAVLWSHRSSVPRWKPPTAEAMSPEASFR